MEHSIVNLDQLTLDTLLKIYIDHGIECALNVVWNKFIE